MQVLHLAVTSICAYVTGSKRYVGAEFCEQWNYIRSTCWALAEQRKLMGRTMTILHGWQSTPGGLKPTYLKAHGHEVINPALPGDDFDEAVRIAHAEFDRHRPDVVVGSSRGRAVAMNIESGDTPLVLLCPAWNRWGSAER